MLVHFVVVEFLQEAKGKRAVGALVDGVAEVNFEVFHVVAFLFVG